MLVWEIQVPFVMPAVTVSLTVSFLHAVISYHSHVLFHISEFPETWNLFLRGLPNFLHSLPKSPSCKNNAFYLLIMSFKL